MSTAVCCYKKKLNIDVKGPAAPLLCFLFPTLSVPLLVGAVSVSCIA